MTVSLKHIFQSTKEDSLDTSLVQPSNWNEEHELTAAAGKVLGRDTSGNGAVQELPISVTPAGDVTIPNNFTVTGTTTLTTALGVASGGTGLATLPTNNVLIGNGTSAVAAVAPGAANNVLTSNGTTWTSAAAPPSYVQYAQNIQSANYTLVLGDAGKQIFHPVADTTVRTYTIPANASVAFPIGTVVLFTVENGGTRVKVAITSDTLVFGAGTTGAIGVEPNNTLMAIKVTATKWMANYLYQTGTASPVTFIAVAHDATPFISAYVWNDSGFGSKFTNPATLPVSNGLSVAFTPAGNAIAVGHTTAPRVTAYPWSASGFGTKYADPATLPTGNGTGVAFSPAGDAIAVAHASTPFITTYPWNVSTGFGAKYADPATLPVTQGSGVAFSPAGNAIAVSHTGSPYVSAYPWSGSGFGTKFANPALPTGEGNGVAFSPSGDAIAVAHNTSPFISAYPWNSGTGFGVKYANPATLPTIAGRGVTFSPAGDAIAVTSQGTPFIQVYPWSGAGFGTKFTNPATLPPNSCWSVAFNPAGNAIAVAHSDTPFVTAYPWSGSGFGTKFANPATLPTGQGNGVAFVNNP